MKLDQEKEPDRRQRETQKGLPLTLQRAASGLVRWHEVWPREEVKTFILHLTLSCVTLVNFPLVK